ncbi:MAG: hypothetical protein K0S72_290, partial [Arthrobacter sp.]|nr:hypothetical protein [Arthrobacter sp.]
RKKAARAAKSRNLSGVVGAVRGAGM